MHDKPLIDMLREDWERWLEEIKVTRSAYLIAKRVLRESEDELKKSKSRFNRLYKDWKIAREEALRAKRRLQSKPYRINKWARDNMGEAINLVMVEEIS